MLGFYRDLVMLGVNRVLVMLGFEDFINIFTGS